MPKKTPIQAAEDVNRMLSELGGLQRQIAAITARAAELTRPVLDEATKKAQPLSEELDKKFKELREFCERHQVLILEDDKRSRELPSGEVGWTWSEALEVEDQECAANQLLGLGLVDLVKIEKSIKKNPLKAASNRGLIDFLEGVELVQNETFHATPSETKVVLASRPRRLAKTQPAASKAS